MSTWGAVVLATFGSLWGLVALGIGHGTRPLMVLPVAIGAAVVAAALLVGRRLPRPTADARRALGRRVGLWSGVEALLIITAVNLLQLLGWRAEIVPAVAALVGLHFLPLAYAIPYRPYFALGGLIIAVAGVAALLPAGSRELVTGGGTALLLWAAALQLLARLRARI